MTDAESLERAIHERVMLVPYDPAWPARFATERTRLLSRFPESLHEVEHIGSTAVPGLPAKPIIDIMAGVDSLAVADGLIAPLLESGYVTSATFNAALTDRRWLMRHADGRRTHHLHLVVQGERLWRERLAFRDALRASPALAGRYALLKAELAARHPDDREAYTRAKGEFIQAVLRSAVPITGYR
ncbi:GrpB family protein [Halomonas campisalis]|uniref:GrpB family protein n=1 Tax=Billgrantia campisalis TaxID=74661 RepID=A0ABS9P884_9GAMM|nr:GrpB family protein [Halomonas campisalis]MCG6657998.1 GrpB family protein [Halomonas campisalis]MDR5864831.1 GrpB family protein [Halomonas campisalis]